jgi:predicted membrane protein
MIKLCPPAIIYLIFSATQIIIDLYNGLRNTAVVKSIVMVMVTLLLNILCEQGLGVVSWIIVFIPFILMTVVVTMILYIFGLDAATGKINDANYNEKSKTNCAKNVTNDSLGNIIIYDPNYNPILNPVKYTYPNLIVPEPNNITKPKTTTGLQFVPTGSSSPNYQS